MSSRTEALDWISWLHPLEMGVYVAPQGLQPPPKSRSRKRLIWLLTQFKACRCVGLSCLQYFYSAIPELLPLMHSLTTPL